MICMWAFSMVPSLFLDRMGRRPTMILGSAGLAVCMLIITVLLSQDTRECSLAAVAFFFLFMCVFASTMNCVAWVYISEVLPLQLRAKGTAIGASSNWLWNFVIAMITPVLAENLGWRTYIIFTVTNSVAAVVFYLFHPETSNKSLEEIEDIFLGSNRLFYGGTGIIDRDAMRKPLADVEHLESSNSSERAEKATLLK